MASPEVIAFHQGGMAIDRRRVLNKITYDAGKGARREDPMFKGLVPNSSGSRNAPFLVHTNQSALPFEPPVALAMIGREGMSGAGNRGALWSPAGRRYAKAVLDRRAMDLLAQQEMMPEQEELAPPSAAKETAKAEGLEAEIDTLRTSLLALAQSANRSVQKGTAASDELKSLGAVQQSLVKLGPDMSMEDLTDVLQLVNDLDYAYRSAEGDGEEFLEGDDALQTEYSRRFIFTNTRLEIIQRIQKYLQAMINGLKRGLSDKERKQLSRSAKVSSGIGKQANLVSKFEQMREGRRTELIDAGFDIPVPGTGKIPTVVPKPTARQKRELTREEMPITDADIRAEARKYGLRISPPETRRTREQDLEAISRMGVSNVKSEPQKAKERKTAAAQRLTQGLQAEMGSRRSRRGASARQLMEDAQAEIAARRPAPSFNSNLAHITLNRARDTAAELEDITASLRGNPVRRAATDDADAEAIRQAARRGTAAQAAVIAREGMDMDMTPGVRAVRDARQTVREIQEAAQAALNNQSRRNRVEDLTESAAPVRRATTAAAVIDRASAEGRAAATARRQNQRRSAIQRAML